MKTIDCFIILPFQVSVDSPPSNDRLAPSCNSDDLQAGASNYVPEQQQQQQQEDLQVASTSSVLSSSQPAHDRDEAPVKAEETAQVLQDSAATGKGNIPVHAKKKKNDVQRLFLYLKLKELKLLQK